MRGDLSETSAADACRGLGGDGATGTLALGGLDGPGHIVFEQGRIVSATAPTSTARLGDRLVGAGFLTEAELLEVLDAQRSGEARGRLGALLVERSLVTHDAIRLFVQEQTLDALFEVLRWRFGSFAFQPGLAEDRSGVRVAMPVDDVLLVVERRHEEWDELSRTIPDLAAVPTFSTNASTVSATLEPDEFAVLASVDGDRDVRELAADLGYNDIELARIVYGLTLLGVVDIRLPEDEIGAALDAALRPPAEATPADGISGVAKVGEVEGDVPADELEGADVADNSPLARVIQLPTSRQRSADERGEPTPVAATEVDHQASANDGAPADDGERADDGAHDDAHDDAPVAQPSITDRAAVEAPATDGPAAHTPVETDGPAATDQPTGGQPQPAPDESSVQAQRAASMADLADTSTSSFPDILRELREHSRGAGRRSDVGAAASAAPDPTDSTPADEPVVPADVTRQERPDGPDDEPQDPDTRSDGDVSEFLRELSRLAGDDEPTTPRPPRPSDRAGSSGSSSSSGTSGSSGSSGDDDPKRRRRGLFGRG